MRVFLYEFATGGGFSDSNHPPGGPLLVEGLAMVQALAADFSALPDIHVITTRDARLTEFHPPACQVISVASPAEERLAIQQSAASADWTLLIAPETASALVNRCWLVLSAGGRLLSPSLACVEIAASKQATADLLCQAGVPVPHGFVHYRDAKSPPDDLQYPVVTKPLDGCASQGIRLIKSAAHWRDLSETTRLEEFIPGLAASVAVLCGPARNHALPACEQLLSSDGHFKYLGGSLPLAPDLDNRARRLALSAIAALPQPLGYLGVDLVLGDAPNGTGDRVIEINPRPTTSYIGLRAATRSNLAAAMLAVATGNPPNISFTPHPLKFTPDGVLADS